VIPGNNNKGTNKGTLLTKYTKRYKSKNATTIFNNEEDDRLEFVHIVNNGPLISAQFLFQLGDCQDPSYF